MTDQKTNTLTIALINTLFDGVDASQRTLSSWGWLHFRVFARMNGYLRKQQIKRVGPHPVEQIILGHQPDVLILNEVYLASWGSQAMDILSANGYQTLSIGYPDKLNGSLTGATVVASRMPAQSVRIPVGNRFCGRFTGLFFKMNNLLIVGAQAAAYYPKIRRQQILDVLAFCAEKKAEGIRVIIAGDLNSELVDDVGQQIVAEYRHLSAPSFPHPDLMKKLSLSPRWYGKIVAPMLRLKKGQRAIDHIFMPLDAFLQDFKTEWTTSDHLAMVATIRL